MRTLSLRTTRTSYINNLLRIYLRFTIFLISMWCVNNLRVFAHAQTEILNLKNDQHSVSSLHMKQEIRFGDRYCICTLIEDEWSQQSDSSHELAISKLGEFHACAMNVNTNLIQNYSLYRVGIKHVSGSGFYFIPGLT